MKFIALTDSQGAICASRLYGHCIYPCLLKYSSLAGATLPALAVAEFLRNGGYDRYLRSLRQAYRHQVAQMREAVVEAFPRAIGLSRPQGGSCCGVNFPQK